jgi:hypothetical protein
MGFWCQTGALKPYACEVGKYSLAGASSEDDCTECDEGYYCIKGVQTSYKLDCMAGYVCPAGREEPIACPKGTYQPEANMYNETEHCLTCPAGTACNKEGIDKFENHLCPPGYYCLEDSYFPRPCPAGSFRPNSGANKEGPTTYRRSSSQATCYTCIGGFYCPKEGTIMPSLCPAGTECPAGSVAPVRCPAGHYCNAGTANATVCPEGYYCEGNSDEYKKCPFGTYCPRGSPLPIPCPSGTYGSGNPNNFDEESACLACGRGLYSVVTATSGVADECLDCTPGYACYGKTSSKYPASIAIDNGEPCPVGHYCPGGTYRPHKCPIGRYAKYTGTAAEEDCLKCKVNWYQDQLGQAGCKKCGPTAYSDGGAVTCKCKGAHRTYIRSLGSCLCEKGYKPKDNAPEIDSALDCEAEVKPVCPPDQDVDAVGNCISDESQVDCSKQCPDGQGKLIKGTGVCRCDKINDVSEVCD